MFVASYHNTERGMRERKILSIEEAARLKERQRRLEEYEAMRAHAERIAEFRRRKIERAAAFAASLAAQDVVWRHTYGDIEQRALRLFGVTRSDIRGKRRTNDIVFARQFIMYWTARLTVLSLPQIGRLMGNRDHTTVLHGTRIYPEKRARMGRHLPTGARGIAAKADRET